MTGGHISDNSRRIARNTVLLYLRMVVIILVGLYTSRVVINALGQDDFGTYGLVGGVVALFGVVTNSLSSAISRFLAAELGKPEGRMTSVFSTTVFVQLVFSVAIFFLAEVVGLWFLNYKLNIPPGRLEAAQWVLHCSILMFVVNMLAVPYNAAIIAHEKMEAFAYISIAEALLGLGAALAVRFTGADKLRLYAILMLAVSVVIRILYGAYAGKHFPECRFRRKEVSGPVVREIGSFAGWTFLGNAAAVLNAQGINILYNLFFGVRVNAARDVTVKLEGNMTRFIGNITTALNPQINKNYVKGNRTYLHELTCKGAKYSYFLFLFFAVPILLETPELLRLWLKIVPEYTVSFVRISMLYSLFLSLGNPFVTTIFATGNVKRYEIVASITNVMALPLSYLAFQLGASAPWAYGILAGAAFLVLVERMVFTRRQTGLPFRKIWADTLSKCLRVTLIAVLLPLALWFFQPPSLWRTLEVVLVSFASTAVTVYFLGTTVGEREAVVEAIKKRIKNK